MNDKEISLKFEKFWKLSGSGLDIVDDGRFVYILSMSTMTVYEWWGETSYHEPSWASMGNLEFPPVKLIQRATLSVSGFKWMFMDGNVFYLVGDTSIGKVYKDPIQYLVLPDVNDVWKDNLTISKHISNPCYANGKIWTVREPVQLTQSIDVTDVTTRTTTNIDFPVKKQNVRADIAFAFNGYVYVTCWNDGGVMKYNADTLGVQSLIRVNANPYKLRINEANRRIYVASYGGMISYIDPDTDVVYHVHNTSQVYGDAPYAVTLDGTVTDFRFTDDGIMWYVALNEKMDVGKGQLGTLGDQTGVNSGLILANKMINDAEESPIITGKFTASFDPDVVGASLGRLVMSTNSHQFTPALSTITVPKFVPNDSSKDYFTLKDTVDVPLSEKDYFIRPYGSISAPDDVKLSTPDRVHISQQFSYQYWNGSAIASTIVYQYLFILDGGSIWCTRLVNELCRENKLEVTAHHMITQGPHDYTGDKA